MRTRKIHNHIDECFHLSLRKISRERIDHIVSCMGELDAYKYYHNDNEVSEKIRNIFLNGFLPTISCKESSEYLWIISESLYGLLNSGLSDEEKIPVFYLYVWCAAIILRKGYGNYLDYLDYILFRVIKISLSQCDIAKISKDFFVSITDFLESGSNEVEFNDTAPYSIFPVKDSICLINLSGLLLQYLVAKDSLDILDSLSALLLVEVKASGKIIQENDYRGTLGDHSYRYQDSWFDLINELNIPNGSRFYDNLIEILAI
ncbi:MAG: hypothetical protein LBS40_04485 [Burkholderiales bacterium]|jgi:hypothetical protein|nr:hypothetical protein [Burkholderiales bacterium]